MSEVIHTAPLSCHALSLAQVIRHELAHRVPYEMRNVIYVTGPGGVVFSRVSLIENTLTDGSKTYDLRLDP